MCVSVDSVILKVFLFAHVFRMAVTFTECTHGCRNVRVFNVIYGIFMDLFVYTYDVFVRYFVGFVLLVCVIFLIFNSDRPTDRAFSEDKQMRDIHSYESIILILLIYLQISIYSCNYTHIQTYMYVQMTYILVCANIFTYKKTSKVTGCRKRAYIYSRGQQNSNRLYVRCL